MVANRVIRAFAEFVSLTLKIDSMWFVKKQLNTGE
jgi:hypothetical protein